MLKSSKIMLEGLKDTPTETINTQLNLNRQEPCFSLFNRYISYYFKWVHFLLLFPVHFISYIEFFVISFSNTILHSHGAQLQQKTVARLSNRWYIIYINHHYINLDEHFLGLGDQGTLCITAAASYMQWFNDIFYVIDNQHFEQDRPVHFLKLRRHKSGGLDDKPVNILVSIGSHIYLSVVRADNTRLKDMKLEVECVNDDLVLVLTSRVT